MFRLVCPICQQNMEVPERHAGSKTRCQRCGQKLLVPLPPRRPSGKKKQGAGLGGLRQYRRQIVGAALVTAVLVGAYEFIYVPMAEASAGKTVEVRDYARNGPERTVRDALSKQLLKPKLLKFVKWGPHLYHREWDGLVRTADAGSRDAAEKAVKMKSFECIVRVAYEIPDTAVITGAMGQYAAGNHDHLFAVKGQYISQLEGVTVGDDWKNQFTKQFLSPGGGSASTSGKGR